MLDLQNKVALVTGGSRGIGRAIALALAAAGAAIAVNYRERLEEAEAVAEHIREGGRRAAIFGADVSPRIAVQSMVRDSRPGVGVAVTRNCRPAAHADSCSVGVLRTRPAAQALSGMPAVAAGRRPMRRARAWPRPMAMRPTSR